MFRLQLMSLALLCVLMLESRAFVPLSARPLGRCSHARHVVGPLLGRPTKPEEGSFLLDDFKTASGEVINPYQILKVSRTASREKVRKAYIDLSRRYHPDGARHRNLLPGNCNNLDEVRDHWERVKLSYEILSDKKMRLRYDRNEALADPGTAVKRAAVNAAFRGMKDVGKGIFSVGAFAVQKMTSKNSTKNTQEATAD
jgi:DnaJ-class molecular chaperone